MKKIRKNVCIYFLYVGKAKMRLYQYHVHLFLKKLWKLHLLHIFLFLFFFLLFRKISKETTKCCFKNCSQQSTVTKTLQKLKLTFLLKITLNVITKDNPQVFCSKSQYFLIYWVSKYQNWKIFFWKICNILPKNQYFLSYEVSIYQDWQISLEKVVKL